MLLLLACIRASSPPDGCAVGPADTDTDTGAALNCPPPAVHVVGVPVVVQDLCDGLDNDGDGLTDEDERILWLTDPTEQGCGDALPVALACIQPFGMALPCEGLAWP